MEVVKRIGREAWSCYLGVMGALSGVVYLFFMFQFKQAGLW